MLDQAQAYSVADSQLAEKWAAVFEAKAADVRQAALDYPDTRSVVLDFCAPEDAPLGAFSIERQDPDLADYLLQRPRHALRVAHTALFQVDVTVEPKPRLAVRVQHLPTSAHRQIRNLRVEDLGRLVSVHGVVDRVTEVRPLVLEAAFECKACGNLVHVFQDEEARQEPVQCENCERQTSWRLKEEMSRYVDYQRVELHEVQEDVEGGSSPERLVVHVREDLVHRVRLGDRVHVSGVLVTQEKRQQQRVLTVMDKVLEAVSIEHQERAFAEVELREEDEAWIRELGAREDLVEVFRQSFAPELKDLEAIKDGLVLQLFGGVDHRRRSGHRVLPAIHVLLSGDPGTGKTSLIRYMSKISPRSVMASGKSSSAAGLTVSFIRDGFDGNHYTAHAGALVKAHEGLLCLDEADKVKDEDLSSLLAAMSIGEFYVNKAGQSIRFAADGAILAGANPRHGRFDPKENIPPQLGFPVEFLDRFSLIFALPDRPNTTKDAALADHMLAWRLQDAEVDHVDEAGLLSVEEIRKYVAYARRRHSPRLTADAAAIIKDFFETLRTVSANAVSVTARSLEAVARLAEAAARMRLSDVVEDQDARRAVRLVSESLQSIAVDVNTGELNIDLVEIAPRRNQQDDVDQVLTIIRRLSKRSIKGYAIDEDVLEEAHRAGMEEKRVQWAIRSLRDRNTVYAKGGSGTLAELVP